MLFHEEPARNGDPVRIGLWGSPGSGKTTYLAAMRIAAWKLSQRRGGPRWNVIPGDDAAVEFLTNATDFLLQGHEFPPATIQSQDLLWSVHSAASPDPSQNIEFEVHWLDVPGGWQDDPQNSQGVPQADRERMMNHLASSTGLVYLHDPTDTQNAVRYLNYTMNELQRRMRELGRLDGPWLPQHLAVCVTKFDDPRVFTQALDARLVLQDEEPPRLPRVPDAQAKAFFEHLCNQPDSKNLQSVKEVIDNSFHPDRVAYYVVSSIGFWIEHDHSFNPDRYIMVTQENGTMRILGNIRPINVLEPLIALEEKIRAGRR